MNSKLTNCPFCWCQIDENDSKKNSAIYQLNCKECGNIDITVAAYEDYCHGKKLTQLNSEENIFFRHFLYKAQQYNRDGRFQVTSSWIKQVLDIYPNFPSISEQADNLLLKLGELNNEKEGCFSLSSEDKNLFRIYSGSKMVVMVDSLLNGLAEEGLLGVAGSFMPKPTVMSPNFCLGHRYEQILANQTARTPI